MTFQDAPEEETDVCAQPEDSGNCDEYVLKYSYDASARNCKAFYYGGCGGNGNRFESETECESVCISRRPQVEDREGKLRLIRFALKLQKLQKYTKIFSETKCFAIRRITTWSQ